MENKIVVVIPMYSETSGGIKRMLRLVEQFHIRGFNVGLHVHKNSAMLNIPIKVTYGVPSRNFPDCDTIISYSDDPYISSYNVLLPNAKLFSYMLSFGMCKEREIKVAKNSTPLCSTSKVFNEAIKYNSDSKLLGFSLDEQRKNFYIENLEREYVTIMYHAAPAKNYDTARRVVNELDLPVIVFGQRPQSKIDLPKNTAEVYYNVDHATLRRIFNRSRLFINASTSEGLNLTPLEAALCGCPFVLCDGASEIYQKSHICNPHFDHIITRGKYLLSLKKNDYDIEVNIKSPIKLSKCHTWDNVFYELEQYL